MSSVDETIPQVDPGLPAPSAKKRWYVSGASWLIERLTRRIPKVPT